MTGGSLLLVALGFTLACANGANDVSKGIATLVGSGITGYRRAILWGAAWTFTGSLLGGVAATAMLTTFGSGLLTENASPTLAAAIASLLGAGAWVLVATKAGLPVSTTHAIVGSLAGVATLAYGLEGVRWGTLVGKIGLPLLVSPLASMGLVLLLLRRSGGSARATPRGSTGRCTRERGSSW